MMILCDLSHGKSRIWQVKAVNGSQMVVKLRGSYYRRVKGKEVTKHAISIKYGFENLRNQLFLLPAEVSQGDAILQSLIQYQPSTKREHSTHDGPEASG